MSLLYTDVQDALRESLRAALTDHCGWSRVLARVDGADVTDRKLWRLLAVDLGLTGDLDWADAAVVLEELGRFVAPVPYLGNAVLATRALTEVGAPDLASGERTATLAVPFSAFAPQWTVTASSSGRLTGVVTTVADALSADLLLVPTEAGLHVVEASGSGVDRALAPALDRTRPLCDLTFTDAPGELLGPAGPAVDAALVTGNALLASEQLGVAEWCLDTTVAYLKDRYQFGRQVGSFQALKHRLADLWVLVAEARAVARNAATLAGGVDREARIAASLARAHCGEVALRAAEECVQLHGGIGFTWEHPAHLYLKRAKSASMAFGTLDQHRAHLADLINLPR